MRPIPHSHPSQRTFSVESRRMVSTVSKRLSRGSVSSARMDEM